MDFDKTLEALKRIQNSAKKEKTNLTIKFQLAKFLVKHKFKLFLEEFKK